MSFSSDRDIRFGDDAVSQLWQVVSELDGARVLLVCGRNAFTASGADKCLPQLVSTAAVRRWSEFRANTDAADLIHGLRLVEDYKPDVILGIGGGSAMDMAKQLCAFQGITDEAKLHEAINTAGPIMHRDVKLVLAPTTSGSGSEATHFGVVYIGDKKYSIAGPALLPDVVVLDPMLTVSATGYQRATSGIDALAQAIESLWSAGATDASREFAVQAMQHIVPALPRFVNEPSSDAAGAMARGSHLAGRAIDVSKTTAAHALSYAFTKGYGVPHGHAVALSLGGFIEAHGNAHAEDLQAAIDAGTHAKAMAQIQAAFGVDSAAAARQRFTELAESIGLSLRLNDFGVSTPEQIAEMTAQVNVQRLGNNPVRFTTDGLRDLVAQGL